LPWKSGVLKALPFRKHILNKLGWSLRRIESNSPREHSWANFWFRSIPHQNYKNFESKGVLKWIRHLEHVFTTAKGHQSSIKSADLARIYPIHASSSLVGQGTIRRQSRNWAIIDDVRRLLQEDAKDGFWKDHANNHEHLCSS
jgi:hypothetical protein